MVSSILETTGERTVFRVGKGKAAILSFLAVLLCASLVLPVFYDISGGNTTGSTGLYRKSRTVIIDPGHGGVDGGAVGPGGVVEKNINLSISLKLRDFFQAAGFRVIMTRGDDRSIHDEGSDTIRSKKSSDLHNRFDIIQQNPNALFLSIHQNIFSDSQYHGTQVFYSPNDEASKRLADELQNTIRMSLQKDNERETKPAGKNLFLLYYAKTPAVLVECGFLSNRQEEALLQDDTYQTNMAFEIFCGTLAFYSDEGNSPIAKSITLG